MITDALLTWYDHVKADLPWRRSTDPYFVWLSEIMLQQTQVNTVIPYFERFTAAFPTVEALAAAPLERVLKQWEGLGYYSRARNLHRAAGKIAALGEFPQTAEALEKLPGIGRYTAGAIASIAFNEAVPVVDGNVIRVLTRLYDIDRDTTTPAVQNELWDKAAALVPPDRPGDYNQAIMELGRTLCRPRAPQCPYCPLKTDCAAYDRGTQEQRPVKRKAPTAPHYDVGAAVIWRNGSEFLIAQRQPEGLLGGLWEFPGGKIEPGETMPECVARELREELAVEVEVGELLCKVKHAFTHFKITLYAYECQLIEGTPQAIGCADWRWVTLDTIDQFAFGAADRQVIAELRARPTRLL
jgi:A/G-specific adenine glycosylase